MTSSRMRELLGPGGLVAQRFAGFEERASQVAMAEAIDATFAAGGRLMVEAGTGTGKTFAYLLPALLHADAPDRRVVIATWTKNLQEQLIEKDLPLLREVLGVPFDAALVQGRENYVCRRRAEQALVSPQLWSDGKSGAELPRVVRWAAASEVGTRGSLGFEPRPDVWAAVRAERGNCLQSKSPFYKTCVWQAAKRKAREAAVLVVNHALLLADLKLRRSGASLLPPYSLLVVDEAHHLEDVAADHLGARVSRGAVMGLLRTAERSADAVGGDARLDATVQRCRGASVELFERVERWLGKRLVAPIEAATELPRGLSLALHELHDRLLETAQRASEDGPRGELTARARSALECSGQLDSVLEGATKDVVAFVERTGEHGDATLCSAPIEPGSILASELFSPLHAAVLTSATLAVAPPPDRFAWLRRGTGVGEAAELVLDSPFDFQRQVKLVVDPLPEPTDPVAWTAAMVERIPEHVRRSEGRAFVLFTSRKTMEAVADGARAALESAGIRLLVQDRGMPRSALLDEFKSAQPAALFGLASFWEGVDVPGRELSHVILTRLPFAVPDHPLERAREARAKERGLDPFTALAVPKAVLRFKQGFGRLIRRKDDAGVVTVLDARVVQRRYGRRFLEALPDCPKFVLRDGEEVPIGTDDEAGG